MMERRKKIALELSDLVIYCRPVPFDEDSKVFFLVIFHGRLSPETRLGSDVSVKKLVLGLELQSYYMVIC